MFFVEFYSDWLAISNTVPFYIFRARNCGANTPIDTQLHNSSFFRSTSKVPKLAQRFSINTSGFTKQLPTILILEDGEEAVRFPPIKDNSKVDRIIKLDYKILLKYFDLESRYL